jgi:uncharacterized protein YndB with AHSA1/START domain
LTEPEHLAIWFPTDIDGDRREGAPLKFVFRAGEGPTLDGEMLAFDPPKVLEMRWGDEETLRFELRPDGEGTELRFTNRFDELGKAARDAAGWHVCLDALDHDLHGTTPAGGKEQWQAAHRRYVAKFGADAATIGPPAGHDWAED